MKKTTEKNRLKRMMRDARQLYLNGLVSTNGFESMKKQLESAMKKL